MTDSASALALKKQLLLTRAALERADMVRSLGSASQSAAVFGKRWSGLTGLASAASFLKLGSGVPLLLGLAKNARLLSPLLPMLLALVRRRAPVVVQRRNWLATFRYAVLGAASVASALAVWKGRQWLGERFGPSAGSDYY